MMGAGKTTVGRLLAGRIGWAFWDNEAALEEATGTTGRQFQREHGQAALRAALRTRAPTVFAAAASVVLNPGVLAGALTAWLRTSPAAEAEHIADSGQYHRPLPADALGALERVSAAREKLYAAAADIVGDAAVDPRVTCDRLVDALPAAWGRRRIGGA